MAQGRNRFTSHKMIGIGLLAAVALMGCGGGEKSADAKAIDTLLIRHYATPSCGDLTPAGRTAFGHPVADAPCASDIAKQAPKKVTVTDVKVTGDRATAVAGDYTFHLAKVNGAWLIDG